MKRRSAMIVVKVAASVTLAIACAGENGADDASSIDAGAYLDEAIEEDALNLDADELGEAFGAPDEGEEELVKKQLIYNRADNHATMYRMSANGTDVDMRPVSTHICFLTRLSGAMRGNSQVAVHRSSFRWWEHYAYWAAGLAIPIPAPNESGDTWRLFAFKDKNNSNSVIAEATCVDRRAFMTTWGQGAYFSTELGTHINVPWGISCSTRSSSIDLSRLSASYLTRVRGKMMGSTPRIRIEETPAPQSWRLHVSSSRCETILSAGARSLYARNDEQRYAGVSVTLSAGSRQHRTSALMRTSQGVCFLTELGGSFDGGGERVRIFPEQRSDGEWWVLEAKAEGGSARGTARCVSYFQR